MALQTTVANCFNQLLMSVTNIPEKTKILLWGKAAGRCQYRGCNTSLYKDSLTQSEFNQSYIAHIVADSPGGPRGDAIRSSLLEKDITNLMLMCDAHHRLIDRVDVVGHPESLLLKMKEEHEERIERNASIAHDMQSTMLIYKANVGVHTPNLSYESLRQYLLPKYYPAQSFALDLSLSNSPQRDRNASFWETELENIETQYAEQVRPKLRKSEINHLSVFAFAPIPLLIKLGTLINDVHNVEIHQSIRSPQGWNLTDDNAIDAGYTIAEHLRPGKAVALNISLSATINNDRIQAVLGDDCSIYTLTIAKPFNDFLKSTKLLQEFSLRLRELFDKIKSRHNGQTTLHVFPAMPIATAIEMGRVWMPKADMPLKIYDENTALGGFSEAINIINQ